jgi:hypothetical protein
MGNLGLFSAIGEIGVTYTYSPIPLLQIELGSGIGFSGLQFSLMPKLSLGNERNRFLAGIGPSWAIGWYGAVPPFSYWLNVDVGYEYRTSGGYSSLVAVGIFRGIAGYDHDLCVSVCIFPQIRFAWGHWF